MSTTELIEQVGRSEAIRIILELVEKDIPVIEKIIEYEGKRIFKINL